MKIQMHRILTGQLLLFFCICAFSIRVLFLLYTQRTWEDALITATYSRNLIHGYGLIHHFGEPAVQGFTSPLSVGVMSVGGIFFPNNEVLFMKLLSLFISIPTLVVAWKLTKYFTLSIVSQIFFLSFLSFELNQIFFGMAGMESQLTTFFLLSGFYFFVIDRLKCLAIVSALFLLTRPDAFIWICILCCYYFFADTKKIKKLGLYFFPLVVPWYVFTLFYFKSLIPHNLLAKAVAFAPSSTSISSFIIEVFQKVVVNASYFWRYFSPFLNHDFIIETPFPAILLKMVSFIFISLTILGVWCSRKNRKFLPAILYILLFLTYRLIFLPQRYFVWHLMPFMAISALLASIGINRIKGYSEKLSYLVANILIAFFLIPLVYVFPMEKIIQRDVENQVRKKIGEYLSTHALPQETVFSESLGYIGYYAGPHVILYDFPGLASPTVLNTLKKIPPNQRDYIYPVISILEPDRLILRITEYENLRIKFPSTFSHYYVEKIFAKSEPGVILDYHNVKMLNVDTFFYLLEKFKI